MKKTHSNKHTSESIPGLSRSMDELLGLDPLNYFSSSSSLVGLRHFQTHFDLNPIFINAE